MVRRARRVVRVVAVGLGWLVLLVAVDAGIGFAWDELVGSHDDPPSLDARIMHNDAPATRLPRDSRVDSPAMAPYPWRHEYFRQFLGLRYTYLPYLYPRVRETATSYFNSQDGVRRSYEPDVSRAGTPVVWFFGGSTMWGEGQRDQHTIPSEVARLAEADGRPIQVVNFGERGYTNWQEMMLFEQELAHRRSPDLVVFYDGLNERGIQDEQRTGDPTHYDLASISQALVDEHTVPEDGLPVPSARPAPPPAELFDLWARYAEVSAVGKAVRRLQGMFSLAPAEARTSTRALDPEDQRTVDDTVSIYLRGVSLERYLAVEHGVEPVFFWQPFEGSTQPGSPYQAATSAVSGHGIIDLTHALDNPGRPVYLDGGHTNELGAHLVARAMYEHLRSRLGPPAASDD